MATTQRRKPAARARKRAPARRRPPVLTRLRATVAHHLGRQADDVWGLGLIVLGLLVTGLNMMPVSQLDGGHVTYALFARRAHWLARLFMLMVFVYMGAMLWIYHMPPAWLLMAFLVLLIGTDHPPTRDDSVRLGWFRIMLGALSLLIPVFCFAPNLIR